MDVKVAFLKNIVGRNNSHNQGIKYVFDADGSSAVTQVAYGVMSAGQQSGLHQHATMEEYFYFIKGHGTYQINNETIKIAPELFVKIPAATPHDLINDGEDALEFVYFGVALDK